MSKFRGTLTVSFSVLTIMTTVICIYCALRSELFLVRSVEVSSSLEHPPINNQSIINLAAVPTGRVSLFRLDLKVIERRLLTNEWIRSVNLQLRPSHTLSINVNFKEPKALIQGKKGLVAYLDAEGKSFGTVSVTETPDLPLLGGFSDQNAEKIREALNLSSRWENSRLGTLSSLSTIYWEEGKGFRAVVTYVIPSKSLQLSAEHPHLIRTVIDFGYEINASLDIKLDQLYSVFRYLGGKSIAVRHVWADAGKKIVVKTVHGS